MDLIQLVERARETRMSRQGARESLSVDPVQTPRSSGARGYDSCVHPRRIWAATMIESRVDRYRQLFVQIGEEPARDLLDRLQVLALTQPNTLREFEALIDRGLTAQRSPMFPNPNRRHNPDRRKAAIIPEQERRRVVRRLSERSALASRG